MSDSGLKVLTWNLRWATPQSPRGKLINVLLQETAADVMCLTEAFSANLPHDGETAAAAVGNSYADRIGGKKSLIWSRFGWESIKTGHDITPAGRFASGATQTPSGLIRVIGICIPWRDSNVGRFGDGNCSRWEDHLTFIKGLADELALSDLPTIVLGDFNQRIPRTSQPYRVADALDACLERLVIATSGFGSSGGSLSIDHIAYTPDLTTGRIEEIPATVGAIELSDHFGVMTDVRSAA